MKLYAVRSKKTGRYFRFREYADDGWGKYEDDVFVNKDGQFYPDGSELPTFVSADLLQDRSHYTFRDHEEQEVEMVEFELSSGTVKA